MSEYESVSDEMHQRFKNKKDTVSRLPSGLWGTGELPSSNYWRVKYHQLIDPVEAQLPLKFLLRRALLGEANDE